jgi:hypothetical protein
MNLSLFTIFCISEAPFLINVGWQSHSPRRPVEMPSGRVPVARPGAPWQQPGEKIEMILRGSKYVCRVNLGSL